MIAPAAAARAPAPKTWPDQRAKNYPGATAFSSASPKAANLIATEAQCIQTAIGALSLPRLQ